LKNIDEVLSLLVMQFSVMDLSAFSEAV